METAIRTIIQNAIRYEDESYELYTRGFKETKIQSAKTLFKKLAQEELKHKTMLKTLDIERLADIGKSLSKSFNVAEELQLTPLDEIKTVKDIFQVALKKEEQAFHRYDDIAKILPYGDMKKLFETLSKEEFKHKEYVQEEYNKCFG
jgi:rubrerythrin